MTAVALDTHAAIKKLQAVGFTEQQAETQIAVLADLIGSETATRQDLKNTENALRQEIADVRRDLKELELRLTIKMGAMLVVAIGAVTTLVKLLH